MYCIEISVNKIEYIFLGLINVLKYHSNIIKNYLKKKNPKLCMR